MNRLAFCTRPKPMLTDTDSKGTKGSKHNFLFDTINFDITTIATIPFEKGPSDDIPAARKSFNQGM